jgi:hypothetical protein
VSPTSAPSIVMEPWSAGWAGIARIKVVLPAPFARSRRRPHADLEYTSNGASKLP